MEEEHLNVLAQWESLDVIVQKICGENEPKLQLVCFDVNKYSILFGTNNGKVHHYSRVTKQIYTYDLKSTAMVIKISPHGDAAAIGLQNGVVKFIKLTKKLEFKQSFEVSFTDVSLHSDPISCIAWGNMHTVYFGDISGHMDYTTLDEDLVVKSSSIVWDFKSAIVQLNLLKEWLVVSTVESAYIFNGKSPMGKFTQIGSKSRKSFGNFGACIGENNPGEFIIYSSRPRCRLWVSNIDGKVTKTLVFKNIFKKDSFVSKNFEFGHLTCYNEKNQIVYILTYSDHGFGVVDPYSGILVKFVELNHLKHLTILENYIFILLGSNQIYFIPVQELVTDRDLLEQTVTHSVQKFSEITDIVIKTGKQLPRQCEDVFERITPISFYDLLHQNIPMSQGTGAKELDPSLIPNSEENRKFEKINLENFDGGIVMKARERTKPDILELPNGTADHRNVLPHECMNFSLVCTSSIDLEKEVEAKELQLSKILSLDTVFSVMEEEKDELVEDDFAVQNLFDTSPGISLNATSNQNMIEQKDETNLLTDGQEKTVLSNSHVPYISSTYNLSTLINGCSEGDNDCSSCSINQNVIGDWIKIKVPGPDSNSLQFLSSCDQYLCCVDLSDTIWYCQIQDNNIVASWQTVPEKANKVVLSPCGNLVWRVHKNIAYALKNPCRMALLGEEWIVAARYVDSIALGDNTVWYTSVAGSLFMQESLSGAHPSSVPNNVSLPSNEKIISLSCHRSVVWVLSCSGTIYVRVGITKTNQAGTEWTSLITAPSISLALCIGPNNAALVVDSYKKLYFFTGVQSSHPRGNSDKKWEVVTEEDMFVVTEDSSNKCFQRLNMTSASIPLLTGNNNGYFMSSLGSKFIYKNYYPIIGSLWKTFPVGNIPSSYRWSLLSCQSLLGTKGVGWLVGPEGNLYCFNSCGKICQRIPLPSGDIALSLASAPGCLWLLTSNSVIFARMGIDSNNMLGTNWIKLDSAQIRGTPLASLSINKDVAWCCDVNGKVYMALGNIKNPHYNGLSPAWIHVESHLKETDFCRVVVSPCDNMVWALDTKRNVFVRSGVDQSLPIGKEWTRVPGIKAVDITVSSISAYVLTAEGDIRYRLGVSKDDVMGTSWQKIPGNMSQLSVSYSNILWGLDKRGWLAINDKITLGHQPDFKCSEESNICDSSSSDDSEDSWLLVNIDGPIL